MPEKTIYFNYFDGIDPAKANKFMKFVADAIQQHNPTEIYFFISSNGGDVDSGFVLYNFLIALQSKVKVTMHNVGTIDSIANIIFIAGQNRFAAPNAAFLFHGVAMNFHSAANRSTIKENLSRLDGMESRMAETLSKASKLTEGYIKNLFHQGESKDVKYALEKEIISEIKPPSIPAGSVHLVMSF